MGGRFAVSSALLGAEDDSLERKFGESCAETECFFGVLPNNDACHARAQLSEVPTPVVVGTCKVEETSWNQQDSGNFDSFPVDMSAGIPDPSAGWRVSVPVAVPPSGAGKAGDEAEIQQGHPLKSDYVTPETMEASRRNSWEKKTLTAAASASAAAATATERLLMMQTFITRLISSGPRSISRKAEATNIAGNGEVDSRETGEVCMAFHKRGEASELLQYHFLILMLAVAVASGTQNALAPNLSRIADTFHFSEVERDIRIGGELSFLYYTPGCIGALAVGLFTSVVDRNSLVCGVLLIAGMASLCTFFVIAYWQLATLRFVAGLASGGVHPLAYSLVGDWFAPSLRSCASAFILGAAGFGAFCGQCLAALLGSLDWRWVFLILSIPLLFMAYFYRIANTTRNSSWNRLIELGDAEEQPQLTLRGLKTMLKSKTNILMLIQAFPGNVPWGVLVVYLHDFLRTDIGLSDSAAIASIIAVAVASFCGMLVGGLIGSRLYAHSGRRVLRFCATTCVIRCVPCVMIFAFPAVMGRAPEGPTLLLLLVLLLTAAFISTLPTANIGAVLLNVNTAEVRGTICALYAVLDDISKAVGTVVASLLAALVGSRALAFQLSMSLWLLSALALFVASITYITDEANTMEIEKMRAMSGFRHLSDEGNHDHMPLLLRQQQTQTQCKQHHLAADPDCKVVKNKLGLSKKSDHIHPLCTNIGNGSYQGDAGIYWQQIEDRENCAHHRSRL